jgi:hypothetical protein
MGCDASLWIFPGSSASSPRPEWKYSRLRVQSVAQLSQISVPAIEQGGGLTYRQLFEDERGSWGQRYPTIAALWRRAWDRVIPFFAFAPAVRRVIYTTNAIESVHARLRKIIKTRGHRGPPSMIRHRSMGARYTRNCSGFEPSAPGVDLPIDLQPPTLSAPIVNRNPRS